MQQCSYSAIHIQLFSHLHTALDSGGVCNLARLLIEAICEHPINHEDLQTMHAGSAFIVTSSEGLTWDNYGLKGWHIDHVRVCSGWTPNNVMPRRANNEESNSLAHLGLPDETWNPTILMSEKLLLRQQKKTGKWSPKVATLLQEEHTSSTQQQVLEALSSSTSPNIS